MLKFLGNKRKRQLLRSLFPDPLQKDTLWTGTVFFCPKLVLQHTGYQSFGQQQFERGIKANNGFQNRKLWELSIRNFGAPANLVHVWVVLWHLKGYQNRCFSKWQVLGIFKMSDFATPAFCTHFGVSDLACIVHAKGPKSPKYVMHHLAYVKNSWTLKYRKMSGNSLPLVPAQQTTESYLKLPRLPKRIFHGLH